MYSSPSPSNGEERIFHGLHRRIAIKHTVAQDAYALWFAIEILLLRIWVFLQNEENFPNPPLLSSFLFPRVRKRSIAYDADQ